MKMLKADFYHLVKTLQTAGATALSIYTYPGMLFTKLQYTTRTGSVAFELLCNSNTMEGRDTQSATFGKWLTAAVAEPFSVTPAEPMSATAAVALVREVITNVNATLVKPYANVQKASDLYKLFRMLAHDIKYNCADTHAAATLYNVLTDSSVRNFMGCGMKYPDMRHTMDLITKETLFTLDRLVERDEARIAPLVASVNTLVDIAKEFDTFSAEANEALNTMYDVAMDATKDEAWNTWLSCQIMRGVQTDQTPAHVFEHVIDTLMGVIKSRHLPVVPTHLAQEDLWAKNWWLPTDIRIRNVKDDGTITGAAKVCDVDGNYKINLAWKMETGEAAKAAHLPALVTITLAHIYIPHGVVVYNRRSEVAQHLEVVRELDNLQGFTTHIFNECYRGNE